MHRNVLFGFGGMAVIIGIGLVMNSVPSEEEGSVRGLADINSDISQVELWENTSAKYFTPLSQYSGEGKIKTEARGIDVELDFEYRIYNDTTQLRLFSDDEEAFLRISDETFFISEDENDWYQVETESLPSGTENEAFRIVRDIVSMHRIHGEMTPTYVESAACEASVCQIYQLEKDGATYDIWINESLETLSRADIRTDLPSASMTFSNESEVITLPTNFEVISDEEDARELFQEFIEPIVRDNISILDFL